MEVLLLPVEQELYAVPLESLREVIAQPRITHLPAAPSVVLGLVNVRGEILPLFDLAALLGTGRTSTPLFAAVVELAKGRAAVAASAVPVSDSLGDRAGETAQPGTQGAHRQGDRLATLLDLETALARVR